MKLFFFLEKAPTFTWLTTSLLPQHKQLFVINTAACYSCYLSYRCSSCLPIIQMLQLFTYTTAVQHLSTADLILPYTTPAGFNFISKDMIYVYLRLFIKFFVFVFFYKKRSAEATFEYQSCYKPQLSLTGNSFKKMSKMSSNFFWVK